MFTAFAKRQFVRSHRLHLHTWWWKRLREAREVHSSSSLNAHSHVDDYSGTLGGVRKVHISALNTSPKNWVVVQSFFLCLSLSKKKKKKKEEEEKKKEKKNERTSWLVSGRHVTQKCQQSLPLLHQWRVSSSHHKDYESFEEIPAALFKASGSKVRWRPAGHH